MVLSCCRGREVERWKGKRAASPRMPRSPLALLPFHPSTLRPPAQAVGVGVGAGERERSKWVEAGEEGKFVCG